MSTPGGLRPPARPGSWATPDDRAARGAAIEAGSYSVEDAVAAVKHEVERIARFSRDLEISAVGATLLPRLIARALEGIEDVESALRVRHDRYDEWCERGRRVDGLGENGAGA